ncbi:hypothetical protein FHS55_001811 [Angulomicrobium tetraedrale]|uniref:Polysaccharide pyruvyl transferase domain-containing protein n=1 Tax=Ancylobacter tetraedralis TaxID=217068 RepID=A0A839Z6A7_9HYPH|nr:polysaccharide pyruvyl transferase family protein [Ancylobacter tetraedralis]MBB3771212.1 hypothetical protein [Ancylobacter tetraedralis]
MPNILDDIISRTGSIPLGWAGSTLQMNYLNFGDALSPVMVSLISGLAVHRVPSQSMTPRMAAVGTIGHGFSGGDVWFWGTGCSNWRNPTRPEAEREPFVPPAGSRFHVRATRGPVSERLLTGGSGGTGIYGDPVWLLPRFDSRPVAKKWKLGCILHLSELADREMEAHPLEAYARYLIPDELRDDIRLITTVTPIALDGLRDKLDEIRACERIVSMSLHGMVVAESYGIPCLYFSPASTEAGVVDLDLGADPTLDLRIIDLYRGLGRARLHAYAQPREALTDWPAVMRAIDRHWNPVDLPDADALIEALPLPAAPLAPAPGGTIWDHPTLRALTLQHDVSRLRRDDKARSATLGA